MHYFDVKQKNKETKAINDRYGTGSREYGYSVGRIKRENRGWMIKEMNGDQNHHPTFNWSKKFSSK